MARVWAQDWITNDRVTRYSLHRNRDDIQAFGTGYNHSVSDAQKLNQNGAPRQVSTDSGTYNRICDSVYGMFTTERI